MRRVVPCHDDKRQTCTAFSGKAIDRFGDAIKIGVNVGMMRRRPVICRYVSGTRINVGGHFFVAQINLFGALECVTTLFRSQKVELFMCRLPRCLTLTSQTRRQCLAWPFTSPATVSGSCLLNAEIGPNSAVCTMSRMVSGLSSRRAAARRSINTPALPPVRIKPVTCSAVSYDPAIVLPTGSRP